MLQAEGPAGRVVVATARAPDRSSALQQLAHEHVGSGRLFLIEMDTTDTASIKVRSSRHVQIVCGWLLSYLICHYEHDVDGVHCRRPDLRSDDLLLYGPCSDGVWSSCMTFA